MRQIYYQITKYAGALIFASLFLIQGAVGQNELSQKLMMGYQGWFLCEGDNSGPNEWRHWFRNFTPDEANFTIDMWPDMSEYSTTYNTNMTYSDGSTAKLFSSYDLSTTRKHFEWMRDYNIHGVYLQRFLEEATADARFFEARNKVLENVITASGEYGRKFSIMYDLSGAPDDGTLYDKLINDWEYLVNTYDVTNTPGYVKQEGKPVIALWGIGFKDRGLQPATFQAIIDYFQNAGFYVLGGVPDGWRTLSGASETDTAWTTIYHSLDMISPWSVGRYSNESGADNWKNDKIVPDLSDCNSNGVDYMPVIWPGFSWLNLHQGALNQIPRNGGNFYWRQAYNAISSGVEYVYVAMFDEVDEATAMFKITETKAELPVEAQDILVTMDMDGTALPSDWYLKLADQTQLMLDGSIGLTSTIPITPGIDQNGAAFVSYQNVPTSMDLGETATVSITMKNTGSTTWTKTALHKLGTQNPQDNPTWTGSARVELDVADAIAPNQEKTFTFTITAPTTPGLYDFQWKMVQDGVEWFGAQTDNIKINVGGVVNYLDDCDALTDWGSANTLGLNTTDNQQGTACIEFTGSATNEFQKAFSTPFNSGVAPADAVLQFWYYVSDASLMGTNNQVELGSGGAPDVNEYNWNIGELTTGWNLITLNISDAGTIGTPDLNAINWFRIYNFKSGTVTNRIDEIQIVDNSSTPPSTYTLTVNSGSGDGDYADGTQVAITADAAPAGQEFDAWVINSGSATVANANDPTTTLTTGADASTVTATYTDILYALTVNSGSGDGSYADGTQVAIAADAAPAGQVFDAWVINSGSATVANANDPTTTLTTGADASTVTATYTDILYALTVNSGSGDGNYADGTQVAITADTAPAGEVFDTWVINSGSATVANANDPTTTLTTGADASTVTATYVTLQNGATFVSQNVPTTMLLGQTISVTITIQNSGTSTWTKAGLYKLGTQSPQDNSTWTGGTRVELDDTDNIAPGESKTFTFDITAPTTPGVYDFQWKMVQDLVEWFGEQTVNIPISVTSTYLDECESLTGWSTSGGNSLSLSTDAQQANGSVQMTGSETKEFAKSYSTPFNSGATEANGVLDFWYYVSDEANMGNSNQVELGSGGTNDVEEYNWELTNLQNGWNHILLNISDAKTTGGTPNLSAINWFRIYNNKSGTVTNRIDGIQIYADTNKSANLTFVDDISAKNTDLVVYPNPAANYVKIATATTFGNINLYDISGRLIMQKEFNKASNGEVIELDISNLKAGVYLLRLNDKSKKLIIK